MLITHSVVINHAVSGNDPFLTDWLNLFQDDIDQRFESASVAQLRTMVGVISTGGSPFDILTDQCPVQRRKTPDGTVASYIATVLVNRSASLEGNYRLESEQYKVQGPYRTSRNKSGEIWTEGKEVIELGWLPVTFSAIQKWGPPSIKWDQKNGFFYPSSAEYALFDVSGLAELDRWRITIEHQQGQDFPDSTVPVTAYWGKDDEETLDLKIPGCVLDAFRECPKDGNGTGGNDPSGEYWLQLNPESKKYVYYDYCKGNVIKVLSDDDKVTGTM